MSTGRKADVGQYLEGAIEVTLLLIPSYSRLCKTGVFSDCVLPGISCLQFQDRRCVPTWVDI